MYKTALVVCALVLQSTFACGIGAGLAGVNGWGYGLEGAGLGYNGLAGYGSFGIASTGGGLPIATASSIAPVGISVLSDNVYEGIVTVSGNLPFLGTVAIEGLLPTSGAGAVSYGCGNGAIGIAAEEGPIVTGIAAPGSYGTGISYGAGLGYGAEFGYGAALGYGAGLGYSTGLGYGADIGCGCGGGLGGFGYDGYGLGGFGYDGYAAVY